MHRWGRWNVVRQRLRNTSAMGVTLIMLKDLWKHVCRSSKVLIKNPAPVHPWITNNQNSKEKRLFKSSRSPPNKYQPGLFSEVLWWKELSHLIRSQVERRSQCLFWMPWEKTGPKTHSCFRNFITKGKMGNIDSENIIFLHWLHWRGPFVCPRRALRYMAEQITSFVVIY